MSCYHVPVLLDEALGFLSVEKGGVYVDATLGGGGHTLAILERLSYLGAGSLFSIDQDPEALAEAREAVKISGLSAGHVVFSAIRGNFADIVALLAEAGVSGGVDGVLMDLGVSSHQLDAAERGFSFRNDAPLDMRMNTSADVPDAAWLVRNLSEMELERVLRDYGEERFASRIARAIVRERELNPITRTRQLASLVEAVVPVRGREVGKRRGGATKVIHPATRTFQALRIAVNGELAALEAGLAGALSLLKRGGRLVVISYHSLEDRIVKQAFKSRLGRCTCPPRSPVCTCGARAVLKELTRHPLTPTPAELERNPRSRSAKLRAAERL
ncbi:MAG: 16S rRNA (cytosine(1402)-N(4))-methyltransferase RsmH [bacterium]|nr:16S rRNA (cytosine(1402)-N(4))-methyltransferase RsmH [bacterium]